MSNNNPQENPDTARREEELAQMLGIDLDLLRSFIGKRIRGTAAFGRNGSFDFTPQRETGARIVKEVTNKYGQIAHDTSEDSAKRVYTLRVKSEEGSADPYADMAEKVAALLKPYCKTPAMKIGGRTLLKTERLHVRLDKADHKLSAVLTIPLDKGLNLSVTTLIGEILKCVAQNKTLIDKEIKNTEKAAQENV